MKPDSRARFAQILDHGDSITADIRADVERLAEKMERIHGGKYRFQIDHRPEIGCIFIVPQTERRPA